MAHAPGPPKDHLSTLSVKQRLFIAFPPILLAVEYAAFQPLASGTGVGWRVGWFLGLALYWVTWCSVVPLLLVGKQDLGRMLKLQGLTSGLWQSPRSL